LSETMEGPLTPYEEFLQKALEEKQRELDQLNKKFAKTNPIRRIALKRELERLNEEIQILSADLEKYRRGLEWLREPTKERDEKSEKLGAVPLEAILGTKGAETATVATPVPSQISARPTVGTPVPSARPTVGTPVSSARPTVGTPVSSPRPTVGTPVARPTVGTPVAKPAPVVGRPVVGQPVRVGTPIGTQPKTPETAATPVQPKPAPTKEEKKEEPSEGEKAESS
jgi:hypothetical protein